MDHKLIVITGASGTGKTTISHYLRDTYGINRVITHTTRQPRVDEHTGIDYYFEDEQSFGKKHYIESVRYAGHSYGSSKEALEQAWSLRQVVSLVLDTKGAQAYAKVIPEQLLVLYVAISDPKVLADRLTRRGDAPAEIAKRLASAEFKRDLAVPPILRPYAKVILNDNLQQAQQQVDRTLKDALIN